MISSEGVLTPLIILYMVGIIRSQKVLKWYYHVYNTTTACIIYLGLLRGSNDLDHCDNRW